MIHDAVHTGQLIIWGAAASVGLLTALAATLLVAAGITAFDHIARRHHQRRGLRRLEHYANHPGARRLHNTDRKENET
ncbi:MULTISPECIES: hypothetical protein [Streptomyces]|uniref:hypothetical protein n=1 Tax=Streptomyces TaxID=1883 RepID=UPI000782EB03|nr:MULTISPECIES: hypothetical protein [Streptomyces]KYK14228.1 hypothetical protein AUW26_28055 [Streptomyces sp. CC71]